MRKLTKEIRKLNVFRYLIQFEHINCVDTERKKEREKGEREKSGEEEEMHRIELVNSKPYRLLYPYTHKK